MGIDMTTTNAEIAKAIEEAVEAQKRALKYKFQYVGESALNTARASNGYKDQTGNLRSSLGYVLSFDGKIVDNSAKQVVKQGTEGAEKGEEYAKQVVRTYPQDVALVVVAGMEYAPHVAARGRDVLDSAKLTAEQLIKDLS